LTETKKDETLVILKNVTISYPHIDKAQPGQKPDDKPKFSGAFVVTAEQQKDPASGYQAAVAAAKAAAVEKFGAKAPAIPIVGGKGAAIRNDTAGKGYPEGSVIINARNESQPGVVYAWPEPGTNKPAKMPQDKIKEELYPGAIVNVQLRLYGYDKGVNKGVAASLQNIQKIADGPRLDNRQAATEAFDADLSQTPAELKELVG
jgi:ssDNA-binding protein